jgi:hypothetical protein
MTATERRHVERIKSMRCRVCDEVGPSEAHEIKQGFWFTSVPLCADCHRGGRNGIHGQRYIWEVLKYDELQALDDTIRELMEATT